MQEGNDVKSEAAETQGLSLRQVLSEYIAALQSDDAAMRKKAMELFRSGFLPESQDRLVDMLVETMDSRVEKKRRAAIETLTMIGFPAVFALSLRYRGSRKASRRKEVVEILRSICITHYLPPGYVLAQALQDRNPAVRRAAVEAWKELMNRQSRFAEAQATASQWNPPGEAEEISKRGS